ncbi:MAG: hypothetical protein Kow006_17970 [Gammaproteobacteria bacterium]
MLVGVALISLMTEMTGSGSHTGLWVAFASLLSAALFRNLFMSQRPVTEAGNLYAESNNVSSLPRSTPLTPRLPDTELDRIGAAVAGFLGYGVNGNESRSLIDLAHPEDREGVRDALRRLALGKPPEFWQHRFWSGEQGFRWLQWTAFLDGHTREWRAVVRDVTEQYLREARVQQGWQVLEQVHCAVITTDSRGTVTSWSRGAERLLGFPAGEVIGQPLDYLATPAEKRLVQQKLLQPLGAETTPINMVVRLRHRYGGSVGVYLVIAPQRSPKGSVTGLVCCAHSLAKMGDAEQVLNVSGERYRSLVENARDIIFTLSVDGRLISLNTAFETNTGWGRDDWLGRSLVELIHPDDQPLTRDHLASLALGRHPPRFNVRLRTHYGEWRTMEVSASPLHSDGEPAGAFGIVRDITERTHAEAALIESESRFRAVVEHAVDPILVHDHQGRLLDVNQMACEHLGYSREELLGMSVHDIDLHCDEDAWAWHGLESGQSITLETEYRRRDGSHFPVEVRYGLIEWAGTEHVLAFSRDITERKLAESRLDHLAHHDVLTGLPNRLLMNDRLQQALVKARRNSTRLALCFLDLDRFKQVNDTLGHAVGDEVLQISALRLREAVRQGDTVARLGGDEFVVILEEVTGATDACRVARKILAQFANPMDIGGHQVLVGTSIGISLFPDDAKDEDTLLRHADAAMYIAKQQGPNTLHCFSVSTTAARQGELGLEG